MRKTSTFKNATLMPKKTTPKPKKTNTKKPSKEIPRKAEKNEKLVIIKWLNIKQNYNSCFGTGKAPSVGHPAKAQINGFDMMTINL
ncbi:uncharacterized protein VP01_1579g2 [Puccinia sorghi]|uniref:Uncharacterized protein n=1 Tax=Puccinia sorghi TaxID=27349 RepID=A0A0L6VJH5_9BASI|nr:uncharacterized protein VP01_1579g2 [Puccinia sorghi]